MMRAQLAKILQWTLRFLARRTLVRYRPIVVGVTGSVGKTSTKEALRAVLSASRRVRASPHSFNNEIGLPLAVLGDWDETGGIFFWLRVIGRGVINLLRRNPGYPEMLILEYGVEHPGDMRYLLSIARPDIGVFTAMAEIPVHVEFFSDPEAVFREKARMIRELPASGTAVLNADDPMVSEAKESMRARVTTFGFSPEANVMISGLAERFENGKGGISFKLAYDGSFVPVRVSGMLGKASAYAAAAAAAVGLALGMNLIEIAEAFSGKYEPPKGRLRVVKGTRGSILLDDTYNASPAAVAEALQTLAGLPAQRKIAVLGDMLELGKYAAAAHEEIGRKAARNADFLVTVGALGKLIAEAARAAGMPEEKIFICASIREAAEHLPRLVRDGDIILLKASQSVRLEKVVKELMAEPERAGELLVRQSEAWLKKPGMYDK